MSMRDFLTRVMNTPRITAEAPLNPRIVTGFPHPPPYGDEPSTKTHPSTSAQDNTESGSEPFHWDIESRSAAILGSGKDAVGTYAYAEHPTTQVLCVSFARGNGPVETWVPGQPLSQTVLDAAADMHCPWKAHHAAFERAMLEGILVPQHGWPPIPAERHVCTMALALAHAYPGKLESVAKILGLVNQKDTVREKRVRVMWKPRKPKRGEDPTKLYWIDTPELRADLAIYNRQDVAVERELQQHPKLKALPASEQDAWVLDAEINDDGVLIDAPLATAASALAVQAHADLDARMAQATAGYVDRATQNEKLKEWLTSQGVKLPVKTNSKGERKPTLGADDIEPLLEWNDLPERARAALQIRLQAAQSAAAKIDRMLTTRCADGRVRGLFRFHGATTGRWSGAGFQPQNLKRPEILKTDEAVNKAIAMVLDSSYAVIKQHYGDVLGVLGDLTRAMLVSTAGYRFIVGDFKAIEARVLPWLAGDEYKLAAFRQFDLGIGRDIYCVTAEQVLGLAKVEEESPERVLGKTFELGLGYQMGSDKLLATIRKARIPSTERITLDDAGRWVRIWRLKNPRIVAYWAQLEAAALAAVRNPGMSSPCRTSSREDGRERPSVCFRMREGVLSCSLPSGRDLAYPAPVIAPGRYGKSQLAFPDPEAGRRRGRPMYGGKWAENLTQAVARDLLVEAMKRLRAERYKTVLHTHDEVGAEMEAGQGSVEEFKRLFTEAPSWAQGLPIAARVFECERFRKD